jgi:hypothetical protein
MATKTTLQTIAAKYCAISYNDDNYSIGGGLDGGKFASHRHEDARSDGGKLTLGEATALFKKATGLDVDQVREVLEYAVPNMEWHHAGKLPKSYGGGMKKTYFLNSEELCKCATNWNDLIEKLAISKEDAKRAAEQKKNLEQRKHDFLKANATRYERRQLEPTWNYRTELEINRKYGWLYNRTKYYSGWDFGTEEKYREFMSIK